MTDGYIKAELLARYQRCDARWEQIDRFVPRLGFVLFGMALGEILRWAAILP